MSLHFDPLVAPCEVCGAAYPSDCKVVPGVKRRVMHVKLILNPVSGAMEESSWWARVHSARAWASKAAVADRLAAMPLAQRYGESDLGWLARISRIDPA